MEQFLNYKILSVGSFSLSVYHFIGVAVIVTATMLILWILRKSIYRSNRFSEGKKYAFYQVLKYMLIVVTIAVVLHFVGVNVTVFVAGSAALLVGLGLGVQNLFNDFISGIIILLDSAVKVGDVVEVNGIVGKVMEIELRTTTIMTRDDTYIILPNSYITGNQLSNWTHEHITSRFDINVGVDYGSDIDLVMELLRQAALEHKEVRTDKKPFVRLIDYADSAVIFKLLFWSDEVFRIENVKSEIRIAIWRKFKEHGVAIPFPQRTLHFATPLPANE